MEHFHFYTNLKFNWENLIFHLCPNVAIFLKNAFIFNDRILKKNNIERTRISMWFGREMMRMWFGLEIDVVGLPPLGMAVPGLYISWWQLAMPDSIRRRLKKTVCLYVLRRIIFSVNIPKFEILNFILKVFILSTHSH